MKKVFLDSSVLVAASASTSGASALILGYCRKMNIKGCVSLDVVGEARKNINLKFGIKEKNRFKFFLKHARLAITNQATFENISEAEKVIAPKDAPILAAYKDSSAEFLITLDRKHFLKPEVANFVKGKKILTPGEFVQKYIKI